MCQVFATDPGAKRSLPPVILSPRGSRVLHPQTTKKAEQEGEVTMKGWLSHAELHFAASTKSQPSQDKREQVLKAVCVSVCICV